MNGLPYYKAYPRDFFEATVGWDFELKGAYRMLLDLIYMHGGTLTDDPRFIAGHLGCSVKRWNLTRAALMEKGKIYVIGNSLANLRADKELEMLRSFQDKQRKNASEPRKSNGLGEAMAKPEPSHTEPEPDTKKKEKKEVGASAPKPADDVRAILCKSAGSEAVDSFIAYRKRKRGGALTVTAAKRLASHLKAIFDRGGDADDALSMAEDRGWQTVEPDWYFNAKGSNNGNGHHNNGKPVAARGDSFLDEISIAARSRPAQGSFGH